MIKQPSRKNKSSFLILPMLGPDQSYFDWSGFFVNCYVQDANFPEFNNHIVLLYKYGKITEPNIIPKIIQIENRLFKDLEAPLVHRYEPDTEHSVFIYDVPKKYQNDYDWFMYSKYSKISPAYKNKVLDFHAGSNIKGILGVLSRDKTMLKNLHKNLGCMQKECKCNSQTYIHCNHFSDFELDFNTAEVWDKIGSDEVLHIDVKDFKRIKMK